jgi:RNA polymerase sigma-70 factor (ECF subfamily)
MPLMDRTAPGIARCIRLAREGEGDALSTLLSTYQNYLRVLAATCLDREVRGKADPSDIVQEALLKAHEHFHEFRGTTEQEWLAWVRRILVNTLAELHRKYSLPGRRVRRERPIESLMERSSLALRNLLPAPGPSPSQEAQRRELGVVLADALSALDPADREVVILRNLQELEWAEIAARMERSPGAVRMLWSRALQRIAPLLKEKMA